MSQIKQKVVVGLGKTGLSCARFLLQQGLPVAVTDSRGNPPGLSSLLDDFPNVVVKTGGIDESLLKGAEEIILSPGVSLKDKSVSAATEAGVPVVGDIELFCRYVSASSEIKNGTNSQIVAITGSNAKSTVTTLVGDMLRHAGHSVIVAGNIGLPVMDVLLQGRSAEFYVLELSSFQLETTYTLNPRVATILNISPDHLDRYSGMPEYIAAKQRIFNGCEIAVSNAEDQETFPKPTVLNAPSQLVTFSQGENDSSRTSYYQLKTVGGEEGIYHDAEEVIAIKDMVLTGGHHVQNALAALTIGHSIGLQDASMAGTLREFSGLAHRCQVVDSINGVVWINDSKGTNTGATIAALGGLGPGFPAGIVLIAGGVGKGADFTELRAMVSQYVSVAVLIGDDAPQIASAIKGLCDIQCVTSLDAAVNLAQQLSQPGAAVLLSPACASFDMFSGFEDRGNQFVAAVSALTGATIGSSSKHKAASGGRSRD